MYLDQSALAVAKIILASAAWMIVAPSSSAQDDSQAEAVSASSEAISKVLAAKIDVLRGGDPDCETAVEELYQSFGINQRIEEALDASIAPDFSEAPAISVDDGAQQTGNFSSIDNPTVAAASPGDTLMLVSGGGICLLLPQCSVPLRQLAQVHDFSDLLTIGPVE